MSERTNPTREEFIAALNYLFAFATLKTKQNIDIGASEIQDFADIGVFLSDMQAVKAALLQLANKMLHLFQSDPDRFAHSDISEFVRRNTAKPDEFVEAEKPKGLRKGALSDFNAHEGAKPKAALQFQKMQQKLGVHGDLGGALKTGTVIVRRFRFRKLLIAVEQELIGLTDDGLVLIENIPIGKLLHECKVWKDSIGFDHGEYTHRLQWLAIAIHFGWNKPRLCNLYRGSSATLKRSVFEAFGYNSLDTIPANATIALPVNVWEFLFDAREARGEAALTWPSAPSVVTQSAPHKRYQHAQRTANSCRVPVLLNKMLREDSSFGLLHAYLTASHIKLIHVHASGGSKQERSLIGYRKEMEGTKISRQLANLDRNITALEQRLTTLEQLLSRGQVLLQFDTPHSPGKDTGDI